MEITGKIIIALPEMSGVSASSGKPWKKREYVLETQETYPKKVHFDFFGDRADQYPLNVGDVIKLSYDIESREYNGRWFTSIRGWKCEPATQAQAAPAAYPQNYGAPAAQAPVAQALASGIPPMAAPAKGPDDDLPF